MEDAGTAGMKIVPTFDGFESSVDRGTSGALTSSGRRGGRLFGSAAGRSMSSEFTSHVKRAVGIGVGLIAGAAVKSFVGDSIAEARESQKVGALTASTIRALGDDAGETNKQIGKLATTLSHKSAIDDEQIQSALNSLLVNKAVRNEQGKNNDIFDRAALAATNYAAALAGQNGGEPNVSAAAKLVGKALADPEKGISRLTKAGVFLTQYQQDSIKAFVKQGDTLDAQKVILGALNDRYHGAAEAQKTMGQEVSVATDNIKEKFGLVLLPILDDVEHAILTKGLPAVRHLVRSFEDDGIPAIRDFAGVVQDKGLPMLKKLYERGKPLAEEILPAIGTAAGVAADGFEKAAPYAERMVAAFNDAPDWVQKGTVFAALGALAGKKIGLFDALGSSKGGGSGLLGLVSKAKPLPVFVVNNGVDLPGGPSASGPAEKTSSKIIKVAGYLGAVGVDVALVGKGAEALGQYLGSRPAGKDPAKEKAYQASLNDWMNSGAKQPALQIQSYDPMTGLPSINFNPASKQGDRLRAKLSKPITPTFDLLGLVEADAKVQRFRRNAEKPITVPVVAKIDKAIANLFGDAFGGDTGLRGLVGGDAVSGRGSGRTRGGVNINIGSVRPHNYREFMGDLQRRSQQANLGGRP